MPTRIVVAFLCCMISASLAAIGCDCNHFPWKPKECKNSCGALVVTYASKDELKTFLHLDEDLARRIVELKLSEPNKHLSSLRPIELGLPEADYKKVLQAFDNLKSLEAEYLVQTPKVKKNFGVMVEQAAPPASDGSYH